MNSLGLRAHRPDPSSRSGTDARRSGRRVFGGALAGAVLAAATLLAVPAARAEVVAPTGFPVGTTLEANPTLTLIAEGCGPGRWRGPWGGCNGAGPWGWHGGWRGPVYGQAYGGGGCPPGSWRGPWGHCRDTPYHGALPGGGWR